MSTAIDKAKLSLPMIYDSKRHGHTLIKHYDHTLIKMLCTHNTSAAKRNPQFVMYEILMISLSFIAF